MYIIVVVKCQVVITSTITEIINYSFYGVYPISIQNYTKKIYLHTVLAYSVLSFGELFF